MRESVGKGVARRVFGLAVGMLLAGWTCAAPPDAAAQTPGRGGGTIPQNVVLVGTSLTLAPFSFINEKGENVGFELDILKAIGERLGLQFVYVRVPFSQNFTSLNAGIFRVSAAAAFITCERLRDPKAVGRFSVPTYVAGQSISTLADNADKIKSIPDFAGRKIGIESIGSTADRVVNEALKTIRFEKVVFPDNPSLFLALEQGRVDAAVQGEFSAAWQSRGNAKIKLAGRIQDTYFPVGYVFRDGDPLREDFDRVLDQLKGEGVLVRIFKEWFNTDPPADSPTAKVVPEVTLQSRGC